jgi:feruloyl-CoA synthase
MQSPIAVGPYPERITEPLHRWATEAPDRTFLAQRDGRGDWRRVTFAETLTRVRAIAQALIDRRLSPERPVLILSGNSIEHGLLALGAMYAGVLYAPVAPAYSLQVSDFAALRRVFDHLRPGLVFAADSAAYEPALRAVLPASAELVVAASSGAALPATPFAELEATPVTDAVDRAHAAVAGGTVAKVLFTSGSTGRPKGVINTQQMLCANQEMLRSVLLFLQHEPPVLCDWSPWNHTAGGNHNFGIALYNGGSLYIDEGKPTPALFSVTLRNLREVACTAHFAVPRLYEMLLPHLRTDPVLRETFFRRLKLIFYAAAGLGQRFWDELREACIQGCGEEVLIMSGFGATETAPFAMYTGPEAFAGMIGVPAPGFQLKLVPAGDKLEARGRGPNVTPGFWKDEPLTRASFDEEGYYRLGDAMRFVDPGDPSAGLLFDGRLAEDFKLSTGTWVSVGPLRARILAATAPLAQDVVIGGHDRDFPVALVFPNLAACRALIGDETGTLSVRAVLGHAAVRATFEEAFANLARRSTGSSTFVPRAVLLEHPPSLQAGEVTDKGSLNQQVVLQQCRDMLEELYAPEPSSRIIAVVPASS